MLFLKYFLLSCYICWLRPNIYYRTLIIFGSSPEKEKQTVRKSSPSVDVGHELSSRPVSRQVLSPLQSLTSVFGMGTGGPFAFE